MTETVQPTSQSEVIEEPKQEPKASDKKFPLIEIFGSVIQGEGTSAGMQTMFLRFGGCDYRCTRCDSLHAVIPAAIKKHAQWLTAEEIATKLVEMSNQSECRNVTFSGGNPCMHKLDLLVDLLNDLHFKIHVETQGTLWQDWLHKCASVTISPKSPGMGEKFNPDVYTAFVTKLMASEEAWQTNYQFMPLCVKVVVFSAQDMEFAIMVEGLTNLITKEAHYYLSLGNSYQPVLNQEMDLVDQETLSGAPPTIRTDIPSKLLQDFRILCEDLLVDPRMKNWRALPQIHVLMYANESQR